MALAAHARRLEEVQLLCCHKLSDEDVAAFFGVHRGGDDEDASLFIADGAHFRSVATARFPKRAPQLNADAAMTDVRGHGGPMDAKKAQEIKNRRARGEKVDATTKELTWFQRNYMWVVPVAYFMFMNMVQEQGGGGGGGAPATPATQKKSN